MNWQLVVSLISGGLMGAVIKIVWDIYQDRAPAIYRRIQLDRIFSSTPSDSAIRANVTVIADGANYDFENLSLVTVTIKNRSRTNLPQFDFGVTLPEGHELISVDCASNDRHHSGKVMSSQPKPDKPLKCADMQLSPLNRNDEYVLKLYIHSVGKPIKLANVQLTTSAPINWVSVDQASNIQLRDLITYTNTVLLIGMVATLLHVSSRQAGIERQQLEIDKLGVKANGEFVDRLVAEMEKLRERVTRTKTKPLAMKS